MLLRSPYADEVPRTWKVLDALQCLDGDLTTFNIVSIRIGFNFFFLGFRLA